MLNLRQDDVSALARAMATAIAYPSTYPGPRVHPLRVSRQITCRNVAIITNTVERN